MAARAHWFGEGETGADGEAAEADAGSQAQPADDHGARA
jgi:hypothetical protein